MDSESEESIMELRAPLSLRLVTGLTLVMCVVLVSQALALMTETWDPCSVIGGLVFATLPSVFATMQYTATFRCNRKATHGSIVVWAILALLTLIGLSSIIAEMSKHRFSFGWSYLIAGFSVILSVILMTSLYATFVNYRWFKRLSHVKTTETDSQPHPHRNHRDLLTLVSTAVVIAILTTYNINTASPRYAENLPAALTPLNLPDGAQQVSYCKGYRGIIAYEFTIDETGFRDWVSSGIGSLESQSAGVSLESISGGYSMRRYNSLCEELTGPDTAYINDGLYYEWTKEDRGVYAAFDRATNRAYFYFHSY